MRIHNQSQGYFARAAGPGVANNQAHAELPSEGALEAEKEKAMQPVVRALINREKEVVAHENAHKSVGGEFAGAMSYSYTVGPDGKRYISGGEVAISIPASDDPEQLEKALERVKRAALAPAKPSAQDQRVAASASAKQMRVRAQISKKNADEQYKKQSSGGHAEPSGTRFDQEI